ncbi:unnamed protein product [Penicillium manginii]
MIFTWSSKNLCIIFRQWRITGPLSLLLSLILIVLLTAGYEGVRHVTRKYEAAHNQRLNAFVATTSSSDNGIPRPVTADLPTDAFQPVAGEGSPLLVGRDNRAAVARRGKLTLAALLLFMTYNGSVMLAVAVGAFAGYLAFADDGTSAQKTVACH